MSSVQNYFETATFAHFSNPGNSIYLAISNKNKDVGHIAEMDNAMVEQLLDI